jgi:hypothetical protein
VTPSEEPLEADDSTEAGEPSDEPSEADNPTDAPEPAQIQAVGDLFLAPDRILQQLAYVASVVGVPLTLYMPWGIVSGHTTDTGAYFEFIAVQIRAGSADAPEDFRSFTDQIASEWFDPFVHMTASERYEGAIRDGFNLLRYVTLRDVNCWLSGDGEPIKHEFFRVALPSVTAWTWGKIG